MWGPYRATVELSHQMGQLQTLARLGICPLLEVEADIPDPRSSVR